MIAARVRNSAQASACGAPLSQGEELGRVRCRCAGSAVPCRDQSGRALVRAPGTCRRRHRERNHHHPGVVQLASSATPQDPGSPLLRPELGQGLSPTASPQVGGDAVAHARSAPGAAAITSPRGTALLLARLCNAPCLQPSSSSRRLLVGLSQDRVLPGSNHRRMREPAPGVDTGGGASETGRSSRAAVACLRYSARR